jgi:drug/metabolite transporter (DMT)-like permease
MNNKSKAILFIIICTITSDIGIILTKYILLKDFTISQTILMRTSLRTIPMMFMIPFISGFTLKTAIPIQHLKRCIFGSSCVFLLTYSTQFISVAESTVINYMVPIFFTILCCSFLSEGLTKDKLIVIGLSFFGVLISINLSGINVSIISLVVLFSAFMSACHRFYVKKVSSVDHPLVGNLYINLFLIFTCSHSIFTDDWSAMSLSYIPILFTWGLISFATQYFSSKALSICDGSVLAPFDYISFVTVVILEYFADGIFPGANVIIGAFIIIFSNLYFYRREMKIEAC